MITPGRLVQLSISDHLKEQLQPGDYARIPHPRLGTPGAWKVRAPDGSIGELHHTFDKVTENADGTITVANIKVGTWKGSIGNGVWIDA